MSDTTTLAERLSLLPPLSHGNHVSAEQGVCALEAVAYIAGEEHSDHPECACPVIATFMRRWNDDLPDDERDALLRPLVVKLVGTRSTPEIEQRRAVMAADWLVREHAPAWLRLYAARDAARDAVWAVFRKTRAELQQSAVRLVERMIEVRIAEVVR